MPRGGASQAPRGTVRRTGKEQVAPPFAAPKAFWIYSVRAVGLPRERNLAELDDSDLADLLQVIRVRLPNFLLRRGSARTR
jgi:hypothetical protein